MTPQEWTDLFGTENLLTLTNEERPYFALDPIHADWQTMVFCHSEGGLSTRSTVFFDGDTIIKVILEMRSNLPRGVQQYREYDTSLPTQGRSILLPLTTRGKAKKLTGSAIDAVTPFGCELSVRMQSGRHTELYLFNKRGRRRFEIGLWAEIAAIESDESFRAFVKNYVATCPADYFDQIRAFRNAKKITVRYRSGDIFRIQYDRSRYRYGIIVGEIKRLRAMQEVSVDHSFHHRMTVPIMIRLYDLITEDPSLIAKDLHGCDLGPSVICSDNDIIWGTHPIVDHRKLTAADLHFPLTAYLKTTFTGRFTLAGSTLHLEWGLTKTTLPYERMSDWLKSQLDRFDLNPGGVWTAIDPRIDQFEKRGTSLEEPENKDLLEEVFSCLGLDTGMDYDAFAASFGGPSLTELAHRINENK